MARPWPSSGVPSVAMDDHDVHGHGSGEGAEHGEDQHVEKAALLLLAVGDGAGGAAPLRGRGVEAEGVGVVWTHSRPWVQPRRGEKGSTR